MRSSITPSSPSRGRRPNTGAADFRSERPAPHHEEAAVADHGGNSGGQQRQQEADDDRRRNGGERRFDEEQHQADKRDAQVDDDKALGGIAHDGVLRLRRPLSFARVRPAASLPRRDAWMLLPDERNRMTGLNFRSSRGAAS